MPVYLEMNPGSKVWWRKKLKSHSTYKYFKVEFVTKVDENHIEIKYQVKATERTKIVNKNTITPIKRTAQTETTSVPKPNPLKGMKQDCSEQMILAAATILNPLLTEIILNKLRAAYVGKDIADIQIDLFTFFGIKTTERNRLEYFGKSEEELLTGLTTLNQDSLYFLRTGQNGGAGHYQLLYFENSSWHVYSSPTNHYILTDKNGNITEKGESLLRPFGTWGEQQGQYRYALTMASEDIILGVIDYIINLRIHSLEYALQKLFSI